MPETEHTDQLRQAFQPRIERVREALERSRQERQRFYNAQQTRERHEADIAQSKEELGELSRRVATVLLEGGDEDLEAMRERARALKSEIDGRKRQLKDLDGVLEHEDPETAERLSLVRAQHAAEEEIKAAKKERDQLVSALDESLKHLEEEASEAFALQPQFTTKEIA